MCLTLLGLAAGPSVGQAGAQESLPETRRDLFGAALAALEDLDGDGVGELLVTAPLSYGERGSVWVVSSASGLPLLRVAGQAHQRWLGVEACAVGDVDRDGLVDLAASWRGPPGHGLGGLVVCSGRDGRCLLSVDGEDLALRLGSELARLDDLDGDGVADLAVLARDLPADSGHLAADLASVARFVVLSLADGHELARVEDPSGLRRLRTGLAQVGDVDGDGRTDVALTGEEERSEPAFVEVYSGRDLRRLLRLEGGARELDFGYAVAGAGDVDADGNGDVLVGHPKYRMKYSNADDETPTSATVFSGADGHVLWKFTGAASWDGFGCALSGAGDVDGDGHDDILIASTALDQRVWLRSGRTAGLLHAWSGEEPGDWHFGDELASIGDLDGDCARDVAVGRGNWNAPDLPGRVRLFSSRSGELLGVLDFASVEAAWRQREAQRGSGKPR